MMEDKSKKNITENQYSKALGKAYDSYEIDKHWEANEKEKFPNVGIRLIISTWLNRIVKNIF